MRCPARMQRSRSRHCASVRASSRRRRRPIARDPRAACQSLRLEHRREAVLAVLGDAEAGTAVPELPRSSRAPPSTRSVVSRRWRLPPACTLCWPSQAMRVRALRATSSSGAEEASSSSPTIRIGRSPCHIFPIHAATAPVRSGLTHLQQRTCRRARPVQRPRRWMSRPRPARGRRLRSQRSCRSPAPAAPRPASVRQPPIAMP